MTGTDTADPARLPRRDEPAVPPDAAAADPLVLTDAAPAQADAPAPVTPEHEAGKAHGDAPAAAAPPADPGAPDAPAESPMSPPADERPAEPDAPVAEPPGPWAAAPIPGDDAAPTPEMPQPAMQAQDPGPAEPAPPAPAPVPMAAAPAARPAGPPFLALVLGGVVAAGIGFATARYLVPEGWPTPAPRADTAALAAFDARLAAQDASAAELAARAGAAEAALAALAERADAADTATAALAGRTAALETAPAPSGASAAAPDAGPALSALATRIDALEARLAAVEARPETGADPAALDALRAEIAMLRDEVGRGVDAELREQIAALTTAAEAERAAAEARAGVLRAETEATARAAVARGALLRVQAALDSGAVFDAALADLAGAGIAVPAALADNAGGVPALSVLQAEFPEAARAALAAAVSQPAGDTLGNRLGSFLRAQTGARALTPRDGDDPDAVLSRAEAALRAGDLDGTLALVDALPPEAQAQMAAWRARADTRSRAAAALAELAATLAQNEESR